MKIDATVLRLVGLAGALKRNPATAADVLDSLGRSLIEAAAAIRTPEPDSAEPVAAPPQREKPQQVIPVPPPWLTEASTGRPARPVALQGSAKQVLWAENLRRARLGYLRRCGSPALVAALSIVRDATWWIAHAEVPLAEIKWPSREQVELHLRLNVTAA